MPKAAIRHDGCTSGPRTMIASATIDRRHLLPHDVTLCIEIFVSSTDRHHLSTMGRSWRHSPTLNVKGQR